MKLKPPNNAEHKNDHETPESNKDDAKKIKPTKTPNNGTNSRAL